MGGVSAQGSWSLWGGAEIGVTIDFGEEPSLSDDTVMTTATRSGEVLSWGAAYGDWWPWVDPPLATFGMEYNLDGLKAGLGFNTNDGILAYISYNGDNFAFKAENYLGDLLDGGASGLEELWGWMKFFDGVVHVETALISRETSFWSSSEVAGEGFVNFYDNKSNFFLVDFNFDGISFGAMLPGLFDGEDPFWVNYGVAPWTGIDTYDEGRANNLIEDVLLNLVFGLKFEMDPVEFAAQFDMSNYGAYIGMKWFAGDFVFELGFQGIFENETEATAGFGVGYTAGSFGVRAEATYTYIDDEPFIFALKPSFWYNVIDDHMRFQMEAEFSFSEDFFNWRFMPELFWNFKGTGAGDWWWPMNTGIGITYVMERDSYNRLAIIFKYGF
jgi:hypothetical protein